MEGNPFRVEQESPEFLETKRAVEHQFDRVLCYLRRDPNHDRAGSLGMT
jgi:hypothetical protein